MCTFLKKCVGPLIRSCLITRNTSSKRRKINNVMVSQNRNSGLSNIEMSLISKRLVTNIILVILIACCMCQSFNIFSSKNATNSSASPDVISNISLLASLYLLQLFFNALFSRLKSLMLGGVQKCFHYIRAKVQKVTLMHISQ